ncbi:hypothetical protein CBR_g44392 [Chara braunii]|uniref:RING-type domain-containing protein n=1 Tax=Chara braunii TaxID=69332 RepID=A0A388LXI5_CHABU|nr:hypothetical protein CBR_g44392 [Chara braunii]|eukprot:GBG86939.1 hypothetical protein CBR_g44392 [Chara braunii]
MGIEVERVVHDRALLDIVELVCPICENLLSHEDTVETPCGHLFCSSCVAPFVRSHSECPQDRSLVRMTDLKPVKESNAYIYRLLGRSLVRCARHGDGCKWIGELSEAASHSSQCCITTGQRLAMPGSSSSRESPVSLLSHRGKERGEDICSSCDEKNFEIGMLRSEVDQKIMENGELMLKLSESLKENEENCKHRLEMRQQIEKLKRACSCSSQQMDAKVADGWKAVVSLNTMAMNEKEHEISQLQQKLKTLRDRLSDLEKTRQGMLAPAAFRAPASAPPPAAPPAPPAPSAAPAPAAPASVPSPVELRMSSPPLSHNSTENYCHVRQMQLENSVNDFQRTLDNLMCHVSNQLSTVDASAQGQHLGKGDLSATSALEHVAGVLRANALKRPPGTLVQDLFLCMQRHHDGGLFRRKGIISLDLFRRHRRGWATLLAAAKDCGSIWFTPKQISRIKQWYSEIEPVGASASAIGRA